MKFLTVVLYCRAGFELHRAEDIEGVRRAKELARYFLSGEFARSSETTHECLRTHRVAMVFAGESKGCPLPVILCT